MLNSLENICKNFLGIDENVPVNIIADFLEKNEILNLESLFLINFEGKNPMSLNSGKVHKHYIHKILGFKKKFGKYGKYYFIYCKVYCGAKNEYMIFFSNKKLTSKIEEYDYEELDLGISSFKKIHYGYKKMETFNLGKKELEKLEKSEDIKKLNGGFWEKAFKRNYINFYPEEIDCYKGITYRKVDII